MSTETFIEPENDEILDAQEAEADDGAGFEEEGEQDDHDEDD